MGRRPTVSLRFGKSPEEQQQARGIMGAIREGMIERGELEATTDEERKLREDYLARPPSAVKRILLFGLPWSSDGKGTRCYRALDGDRQWAVGRDVVGKWTAMLHDDREGSPHMVGEGYRTLREAKTACEEAARRLEGPG